MEAILKPPVSRGEAPHAGSAGVSLPIIDVACLRSSCRTTRKKAADEMVAAAADSGFLYLANHGVPESLFEEIYRYSKAFFSQSLEAKNALYIGSSPNHRGYVPTTERGCYSDEGPQRRYEAFDMGVGRTGPLDPLNPLLGPNVWPEIDGFQACMTRYLTAMRVLTKQICFGVELALEMRPGFFWSQMQHPVSQLRLLHYLESPKPTIDLTCENEDGVGMGAHTDYELFTLLHSRSEGFQVMTRDNQWVDAPPIEGTLYFNIGDMFEAWTAGILRATPHRVIDRGIERYSLPYFAATDYDVIVEAPPSLAARSGASYGPIHAGDHLLLQLMRDFPYLREQMDRFDWLPQDFTVSPDQNPFEDRIHRVSSPSVSTRPIEGRPSCLLLP